MSLPIKDFIIEKIREYDPDFDLRDGTAFNTMFVKALSLIIQPFRDELNQIEKNQSIKSILESDDPNAFPEDAVDALISNVFVERKEGNKVTGVVRVYFIESRALDILDGEARFLDEAGNYFINTAPIFITSRQMEIQLSGDYYYIDVPVQAEEAGDIFVDVNGIVAWDNAPSGVAQVGNEDAFSAGADKETNLEFISRAKNSIAVRDLVVGKGIVATLNENFGNIEDVASVGLGDPEMQRDIIRNIHVGGHVDVYVKTPKLISGSFDAYSLLTDSSRKKYFNTQKALTGDDVLSLGIISIDRSNMIPVVAEIADDTAAEFISGIDLAGGIDLSTLYNIKLSAKNLSGDTVIQQIGLQGVIPSNTSRDEIVSKINAGVGFTLAYAENGTGGEEYIKFKSPVIGPLGFFSFQAPSAADATALVFGLNQAIYPHVFYGTTAKTFSEGGDYLLDDDNGTIQRIPAGTIPDGDKVDISFEYNPISIDIGKPVRHAANDTITYSIREGREDTTITDLAFIDIESIEILDPVSGEPSGEVLDGIGGFGQGSFGQGLFGIGQSSDYKLVVVNPHTRYSIREENYIEFNPGYIGRDVRINYRYAPEIEDYQLFADSARERVLTSKILMKHFIPVFVDVDISYDVPESNVNIKTNDELIDLVAQAINDIPRGQSLQASDLIQLLYGEGVIKVDVPFEMRMEISHVDGTNELSSSDDTLIVPSPTLDSQTGRPISKNIAHFLPRNIKLTRRIV